MTTIAMSRKQAACDLQYTYKGGTKFKGASKIIELSELVATEMFGVPKALIGFCGNADDWGQVVRWYSNPKEKPPKVKDLELIMLNKEGIYHASNLYNWLALEVKHFAIGSGMEFAMGAMKSGLSPIEACKVANKFDVMTGMGYKEFTL